MNPPLSSAPARALHRRLTRYLWREWIRPLALPLLAVAAAKSAVVDINYVPTGSMKPTILGGDVVFINKLAYDLRVPFTFVRLAHWSEPARGDIVVCFAPDNGTRLVKRVIGLPGDTLELHNDAVFLNGVRQSYTPLEDSAAGVAYLEPEERARVLLARENLPDHPHAVMITPTRLAVRNFGPVTLSADSYFVMGDQRDNSQDSRFFGFMPRHAIIGEATAVVASADLAHWLRPRFARFFTPLE